MAAFRAETGTRKLTFLTFITSAGLLPNEHSIGLVDVQLTAENLFLPVRIAE